MTTQIQTLENRFPQRLLLADGVLELCIGVSLLLEGQTLASWFGISAATAPIGALIVLAFGAFILFMAQRGGISRTLFNIAIINIVFALFLGVVLFMDWNTIANEGRWTLAIGTDVFFMLGVAELY